MIFTNFVLVLLLVIANRIQFSTRLFYILFYIICCRCGVPLNDIGSCSVFLCRQNVTNFVLLLFPVIANRIQFWTRFLDNTAYFVLLLCQSRRTLDIKSLYTFLKISKRRLLIYVTLVQNIS